MRRTRTKRPKISSTRVLHRPEVIESSSTWSGTDFQAVEDFYDDLAPEYDVIFGDWVESRRRQAEALHALICSKLGLGPLGVLDATCGIGTQALGLAELGYEVSGSDLSKKSIERARKEAELMGTTIDLQVANVLSLEPWEVDSFDVVISCDNSLPHLLEPSELSQAVAAMAARTRPGGIILSSLKDYEHIDRKLLRSQPPQTHGEVGNRRMITQVWDWHTGSPFYDLSHVILREANSRGWDATERRIRLRAVKISEVVSAYKNAGLREVEVIPPIQSGYFQTIVLGQKPL